MTSASNESSTRGARWWSRDISFPHLWRYWPPIIVAGLALSAVLAAFVSPKLVFTGEACAFAAFACLWGPWGALRPTRNVRRALPIAACVFLAMALLPVGLHVVVSGS